MKIKNIPGYENYYSISDNGLVFSKERTIVSKRGIARNLKHKVLSPILVLGYEVIGNIYENPDLLTK